MPETIYFMDDSDSSTLTVYGKIDESKNVLCDITEYRYSGAIEIIALDCREALTEMDYEKYRRDPWYRSTKETYEEAKKRALKYLNEKF